MQSQIDYYGNLARIMYKTRGCRFGAASALQLRERWSIGTTAFLTTYLLSWSIALLAFPELFSSRHAQFYSAISAIASAASLVVSLMDYAQGRSVLAEKLNQNALAISSHMRELERQLASPAPDFAAMDKIAIAYERTIAETQVNHTSMDFKRWVYNSSKPSNIAERAWFSVRSTIYGIWFFFASMWLYLALIAAIVISTSWYTLKFVAPYS